MPALWTAVRRSLAVIGCLAAAPALGGAQVISLKTIPVAAGDQFLIFPSQNMGMGSVSIALPDEWLDPFVNPALGARISGSRMFGSPVFYDISGADGSAKTLPLGALFASGSWFAAGTLAIQQLQTGDDNVFDGPVPLAVERTGWIVPPWWGGGGELLSDQSASNLYAFGSVGRKLGKTAVGVSAFYGNLNAVDGVDLLYALARNIDQYGHVADVRLGALHDFGGGRSLEVLGLRSVFSMTHDVTYVDWIWDPAPVCNDSIYGPIPCPGRIEERMERNLDRTETWGFHSRYQQPLTNTGWRLGAIFTANRKTHPKIPNYELMNIPRDPGTSWAYNAGVGLSRTMGPARFGLDLVLEPIWSHTWAAADTALTTASGGTIPLGGRTVENRFAFANAHIRLGVAREDRRTGLQFGLQVRSISYRLDQTDLVAESSRVQRENWMEWTPTWGASLKFPEFEIRYQGRVTTGTGRPGVAWTGVRGEMVTMAADFIPAPSGPLTLQDARVLTHQVAVALPIR